jgi:hypothetical protein
MRSVRSRHVKPRLKRLLALSALVAALAAAGPVSGASAAVLPIGFQAPIGVPGGVAQGGQASGPSGCVGSNAPSGIGDAGATSNQLCGVTLAFVGPSIGQVSSQMGPTIIGSTVLAPVTVSAGPVATSSLP